MNDAAPTGASRIVTLELAGPAGPLEALLQERDGVAPRIVAVVCHPHPLYGGTMHNKVVHRVASTLHGLDGSVLRFNFRGVGRSAGTHDRGKGELDDARCALAWLRERHPDVPVWIAGFSFGAWIAARLAAETAAAERLILIAPGVHTSSFEVLRTAPVPKLVLQGTADDVCRPEDLAREFPSWADPKRLIEIPGASHFFDRQLHELGQALLEGVRGT